MYRVTMFTKSFQNIAYAGEKQTLTPRNDSKEVKRLETQTLTKHSTFYVITIT